MSRHRNRRSHRLPFRSHLAEALEPRTLLAFGPASLVKDINTSTNSSEPSAFFPLNGRTLFRADDGVHGAEWFATDGTAAGTTLLRDIVPGWSSIRPDLYGGEAPVVLGGTMLFRAFEPSTGYELWKTDGTPAGTSLMKDICPGPQSSNPSNLKAVGNLAYFSATDGEHGYELWKSDGTEAGTQMVADLSSQTLQWDVPIPLAALGDRLVFAGPGPDTDTSTRTYEPWVTDGTAAGTRLLRNIRTTGPSMPGVGQNGPVDVAVSNGVLYFAATGSGGFAQRELWRTDGTPEGTALVADPTPSSSTGPRNLVEVGGAVYFTAGDIGSGPITTSTRGVYRTDPAAGVVELGKLGLRPDAIVGKVGGAFCILGLANGKVSLFKNDPAAPAATGLVLVKELAAASEMTTWPGRIVDDDGAALFLAQAAIGEIGVRLWRSDGTAGGTVEVMRYDVGPDPNGVRFAPDDADAWILSPGAGGLFYFALRDAATGVEPYRTDGTAAGTYQLLDLNRDTYNGIDDSPLVWVEGRAGGRALFAAADPGHGEELWATDGTEAGTTMLKDIRPGPGSGVSSTLSQFSPPLNGRVYFRANTGETGLEPWTTDGTSEGTYSLGDLLPGTGDFLPTGFTPFRDSMYFRADSGTGGVWITDGTPAGTRVAIPLEAGGYVYRMFVSGDWMYYWVRRANGQSQLWKTDGTDAGNTLVKVIATSGYPFGGLKYSGIYTIDGVVYFRIDDTPSTSSLWRSDGTATGTSRVKLFPNPIWLIVSAGDQLLMTVASSASGTLWLSDGTPAGTVPAAQAVPQLGAVPTQNRVGPWSAGGVAYLFATAADGAVELWRTDGTAGGTQTIERISREGGARVRIAGVADGQLYFVVLSPDYWLNWELWRTDGSAAGTVMLQQFVGVGPELQGGSTHISAGGGHVFFNADDGVHGWELWSIPYATTATVAGRHVFYNNSAFDGHDPAATAADLSAIATDKAALLPGQPATFANVTSYDKGINGVLIDLAGAIDSALTADDFEFRVGRSGDPGGWAAAPAPVSVVAVPSPVGAAIGRYAITWADGAIHDTWLRVTVRSNERTGLASPDVFYFGNLVGEIGDELTGGSLRVTVRDMLAMRRRANLPAAVTSATDINRDGTFNAADLAIVRRNLLHSLPLLSTPVPVAPAVAQRPSPPRTSAARRGVLEVLQ